MRSPIRVLPALFAAVALLAAACGSGSPSETTGAPDAPADAAGNGSAPTDTPPTDTPATDGNDDAADAAGVTGDAASVAEENIDDLVASDDVRLLEVLDVETGEATTIADTVTGDRPVLLWFWAPH